MKNLSKNFNAFSIFMVTSFLLSGCAKSGGDSSDDDVVTQEHIDALIQSMQNDFSIPGIAIGIVTDTNAPRYWFRNYGVMSKETGYPIDEETNFPIASVSKLILGAAMNIAHEQGIISLEDPIHPWLELTQLSIESEFDTQKIRFMDLARHRSGIIDWAPAYQCTYFLENDLGASEFLVNLADTGYECTASSPTNLENYLKAYFEAGGEYYNEGNNIVSDSINSGIWYSNIGAALAGFTLEVATGESLEHFTQRNIFELLGMNNTSWHYENLNNEQITDLHFQLNQEQVVLPRYDLVTWPDGGLKSNVVDLLKFAASILNEGELQTNAVRILEKESVTRMLTPLPGDAFSSF